MPFRAKSRCKKFGCPTLLDAPGYCDAHKQHDPRKRYDQQRGTRQERGYDERWLRLSRIIRRRDPFCMIGVICDPDKVGRRAPSTETDHIIPAVQRPDLFYDESNLQGACHECHSWKTATQDSNFAKGKECKQLQPQGW